MNKDPDGLGQRDPVEMHPSRTYWRSQNERQAGKTDPSTPAVAVLCECHRTDCWVTLDMSPAEYAAARGAGAFIVATQHTRPRDRVILAGLDYVVVPDGRDDRSRRGLEEGGPPVHVTRVVVDDGADPRLSSTTSPEPQGPAGELGSR